MKSKLRRVFGKFQYTSEPEDICDTLDEAEYAVSQHWGRFRIRKEKDKYRIWSRGRYLG